MSTGIEYQPLDASRQQIRILRLHPPSSSSSPEDEAVTCHLETVERANAPAYVALSYTWGRHDYTATITLNGSICRVSPSVDLALREIRRRDPQLCVWVDQVCINQADAEEKTLQVLQMRHIYSDASAVFAWLGPAFEDSDFLFAHMQRLGDGVLNQEWEELIDLHEDEAHLDRLAAAYDRLCRRPYWSRLWIMQEFSMAPDTHIVCGSSSIPFTVLEAVQKSIVLLDGEIDERPTDAKQSLLGRLTATFEPISRSFMDSVVTRRSRFRNKDFEGDRFFQVLITCLVLECDDNYPLTTDPRDRVFSLLYLGIDAAELEGILDYSKTCEEVYHDTAVALLKQGSIGVLSYCQFPKEFSNLPTWVPDWSMPLRNPCNMAPFWCKFSASGNTTDRQNLEIVNEKQLQIRGFPVDTVGKMGNVWHPDWLEPLDVDAALGFIHDIERLCKQSPRVRVHEELLDAVRVAACDGAQYGEEDLSGKLIVEYIGEFMEAYERLKDLKNMEGADEKRIESEEPDDDDWLVRALHFLPPRRPFITETGFLGLGPPHMEVGDEVCIFYGGQVPYVVRAGGHGDYTMVGEVFVLGMMNREALKGEVEDEVYILH